MMEYFSKTTEVPIYRILRHIRELPSEFQRFVFKNLREDQRLDIVDRKLYINTYYPPIPSKAFNSLVFALTEASKGHPVPEVVTIAVTHKCLYDCFYCSVPDKNGEDMPLYKIKETIKNLQGMGTFIFALTGGEPLLRNDLEDIISCIDERSIVKLYTTGYGLNLKKASELKNAGLDSINIALDNIDKDVHDRIYGTKGAYETSLKAIENAKRARLLTCVSTVVTKERIESGEIITFLKYMKKIGVDEVTIFEPVPTGKVINETSIILSRSQRKKLIELHKETNKNRDYPRVFSFPYVENKNFMGCCAGYNRLHITASGEVLPCDFTPLSFGNIISENIEDIWKKMHTYFNKPRESCIMIENHKKIYESSNGKLPIKLKNTEVICLNPNIGEIPLFYKKLGVK